jgi:Nuclease-related domain
MERLGADLGWVASRILKLRRPDVCCACGAALSAGTRASWDAEAWTVTCVACLETATAPVVAAGTLPALDRGQPGGSVAREFERRNRNRETRTREAHPRIGGLLLALREPPQHETAFHRGDLGEKAVAASLERLTANGPAILLHDRRMPGGRGNIDHLAVASSGVFVIDAKDIKGRVRIARPLFRADKLLVSGYNRTTLIDGLDRQVAVVRAALDGNGYPDVPVQGVLCFTKADLPLLGTLKMRGHLLLYRKALAKRLNADGPLESTAIDALARTLAAALPPA